MKLGYVVLFAGILAAPVLAKSDAPVRAQLFQRIVDCRAIADDGARVTCYDREVSALDAAEKSREVVIVDKEQVRAARRSLFGLPLPNFHLFGGAGDDKDADSVSEIESKIASATPGPDGWRIRLEDGSVWTQTDGGPIYRTPKPGLVVVVKRGALGSYMLRVAGAPGVKVKRTI